jgi:hypothetical protein
VERKRDLQRIDEDPVGKRAEAPPLHLEAPPLHRMRNVDVVHMLFSYWQITVRLLLPEKSSGPSFTTSLAQLHSFSTTSFSTTSCAVGATRKPVRLGNRWRCQLLQWRRLAETVALLVSQIPLIRGGVRSTTDSNQMTSDVSDARQIFSIWN